MSGTFQWVVFRTEQTVGMVSTGIHFFHLSECGCVYGHTTLDTPDL